MQALALARQRIRDRIQRPSTPTPVRMAHALVEQGRGYRIPLLSSPLAREILSRGYDARTLAQLYDRESSEGVVGRTMDRLVLDLPLHEGLRELHEAAVGEARAAVVTALRGERTEVRALFMPCGVGSELFALNRSLRERWPQFASAVRCWGVDPDPEGELLPLARAEARAQGLDVEFIREDLRRHRSVADRAEALGGFDVISTLGLSQRYAGDTLAGELGFLSRMLAPGGTLLIDRRERCEESRKGLSAPLRLPARTMKAATLHAMLRDAGLAVAREHPSGEGGCVLSVCRKPEA